MAPTNTRDSPISVLSTKDRHKHLHAAHRAGQDACSTPALSSHSHIQAAGKQLPSPHRAMWRPW
ncbi:hypothetical protein INR49_001786 [Caranx melampygus]|nr:hypothetical protein INR49_001786 [Caranx melampygus]